jgi:peptidoglycan/LPS O-acetylase OafA/YrhL
MKHYVYNKQHSRNSDRHTYDRENNSVSRTFDKDRTITNATKNDNNDDDIQSMNHSTAATTIVPITVVPPQQQQSSLVVLPETTAYWSREPYAWSSTSIDEYTPPLLTSSKCSKALYDIFQNTYYNINTNINTDTNTSIDVQQQLQPPNFLLSIIVEASSHPSGLNALFAQPYMYAGPGLGNIDLCPLQTCIAGGRKTDSITFASICIVPDCTAYDLSSEDFVSTISRIYDSAISDYTPSETIDLGREYLLLLRRIADINKFLQTGWTCGDFIVPFDILPFGVPYILICCSFVLLSLFGTIHSRHSKHRRRNHHCQHKQQQQQQGEEYEGEEANKLHQEQHQSYSNNHTETLKLLENNHHQDHYHDSNIQNDDVHRTNSKRFQYLSSIPSRIAEDNDTNDDSNDNTFWSAFDIGQHLHRLVQIEHSIEETSCIDGLRVGSIFWIILGHVLAIQSSSGAGYSNPSNFLPPTGLTTTLIGQLLFSSRLAVDTFLTISGYLVVHVLCKKTPLHVASSSLSVTSWWNNVVVRYCTSIPILILSRVGRILPLYAMCLGFFTQIAPHMGNGPFWHQWIHLLKPCHDYIWTNFLFINNFIPLQTSTTNTCFYHSWYLAVDMQLFILAPLLIFWYQYCQWQGQIVTIILFFASVTSTAYWSYIREWSINTFDGSLVNNYDVEAYANPIIRAQAYLAGMYIAFLINNEKGHRRRTKDLCMIQTSDNSRPTYNWSHRTIMAITLLLMGGVSFVTVTGAYSRRPCTYNEYPYFDACGSSWSPYETYLYTAFGRTIWIIGTSIILYLCIGRGRRCDGHENIVSCILSWTCWTPLSQLSFGAYLIHPIVVFIWKLGDREKQVFRLLTFGMDYLSVCVVSFVASLLASILIEFPCAILWKSCIAELVQGHRNLTIHSTAKPTKEGNRQDMNDLDSSDSTPLSISPLTPPYVNYGSSSMVDGAL